MRYALILLPIALAACADPVSNARKELEIVQANGGSNHERCVAHRKLVSALLSAQRSEEYGEEKLLADTICLSAEIDRGR